MLCYMYTACLLNWKKQNEFFAQVFMQKLYSVIKNRYDMQMHQILVIQC